MAHMHRTRVSSWVLGLLFLLSGAAFAGEGQPARRLVMGLVPNVSARTLISAFQPLREHLEKVLKQPVEIYTAPDYRTFHEQTQRGDFDLVVTPAHFAWLAMKEARYTPLVTYQTPLQSLLLVGAGSRIDSAQALRGKTVGIVDPLAIVSMRGLDWFQEQGLQPGKDFVTRKSAPNNTAALAVGNGELDAAIIGSGPYRIMPEDIRVQVRVLAELGATPNAIYLASGRLSPKQHQLLRDALLAFNDTPTGRRFMEQYGYAGFKPIGAADLKPMESYARHVKALLARPGS